MIWRATLLLYLENYITKVRQKNKNVKERLWAAIHRDSEEPSSRSPDSLWKTKMSLLPLSRVNIWRRHLRPKKFRSTEEVSKMIIRTDNTQTQNNLNL